MKTITLDQYYHWQRTGELPQPTPKRPKRVKPGRFAGRGEAPPLNYPAHLDPAWRAGFIEWANEIRERSKQ